mmetsp:Transcript_19786/g.50315  ORF Transcript_19786/g.50315 Transcript_19786/m.50315 type:complete len:229 (+) Transcript_19786:2780-3466(+)
MQTASRVSLTPSGGFFIDLTSTMSSLRSAFNAATALSSAGIAVERSASHARLSASASCAASKHCASSTSTCARSRSARRCSAAICAASASTSAVLRRSSGCSSSSSDDICRTCSLVVANVCKPAAYRRCRSITAEASPRTRLSSSSSMLRYEPAVTATVLPETPPNCMNARSHARWQPAAPAASSGRLGASGPASTRRGASLAVATSSRASSGQSASASMEQQSTSDG